MHKWQMGLWFDVHALRHGNRGQGGAMCGETSPKEIPHRFDHGSAQQKVGGPPWGHPVGTPPQGRFYT